MGVEMVLRNGKNKTVASSAFRPEGADIETATQESPTT
jgi:hypothetical protein